MPAVSALSRETARRASAERFEPRIRSERSLQALEGQVPLALERRGHERGLEAFFLIPVPQQRETEEMARTVRRTLRRREQPGQVRGALARVRRTGSSSASVALERAAAAS